jgi:hypothetical protein
MKSLSILLLLVLSACSKDSRHRSPYLYECLALLSHARTSPDSMVALTYRPYDARYGASCGAYLPDTLLPP